MRVFLVWKRRYADVRAGTQAPPLRFRLGRLRVGGWRRLGRLRVEQLISFGQIACGWLMSFGWIACKWLFCLCGIARKCITEIGRGGASVPARVAPQGRIHRSIPRAQCVHFWYGNAAARTFGRAHRHRPYGFVWVDCAWTVDAVLGIAHGGSV